MSEHDALTSIAPAQKTAQQKNKTHVEAFSFGDPIPVLDRRELLDYVECVQMDRWYEPPVSFEGLARTYRAAVHHSSPIAVKRNILSSTFIPHPFLSQQAFSRFVQYGMTTHMYENANNIRQAMKSAKGQGNFRNLFMYSPNGKKDGIQIISL
jgi:Bacteriophage capsid portal protein